MEFNDQRVTTHDDLVIASLRNSDMLRAVNPVVLELPLVDDDGWHRSIHLERQDNVGIPSGLAQPKPDAGVKLCLGFRNGNL